MRIFVGLVIMTGALSSPVVGQTGQICLSETEIPSSTPTSRFSNHGDGTVTDNETGLMWAQCAAGRSGPDCGSGRHAKYTWAGALARAAGSNLAGFDDWRLPNIKELLSIVEQRCVYPSINQAASVFPNTRPDRFWSASPYTGRSSSARYVEFSFGNSSLTERDHDSLVVRLVRSGQ